MKFAFLRILASFVACLACTSPTVAQISYPNKPIRLVVPYAPGGSTSVLAQSLALALGKKLGQSVYIDHRPGGNTIIGTGIAAKSAADGYTLLLTASSHVVVPLLTKTPYDPFKDFTVVGSLAKTEFVLAVHPGLPAQSLDELLILAKKKQGGLTYASAGNGSGTHLIAKQFEQITGVRMLHVPYKGAGPMVNDLVGGQVDAAFLAPAVASQFIQSRQLRAIAVSGSERQATLSAVPTFSELGLPNFNATNWYGVLAPANTPNGVVIKIANAINDMSSEPEFMETLASLGLQPYNARPEEFRRAMQEESVRMAILVRSAKITLD